MKLRHLREVQRITDNVKTMINHKKKLTPEEREIMEAKDLSRILKGLRFQPTFLDLSATFLCCWRRPETSGQR